MSKVNETLRIRIFTLTSWVKDLGISHTENPAPMIGTFLDWQNVAFRKYLSCKSFSDWTCNFSSIFIFFKLLGPNQPWMTPPPPPPLQALKTVRQKQCEQCSKIILQKMQFWLCMSCRYRPDGNNSSDVALFFCYTSIRTLVKLNCKCQPTVPNKLAKLLKVDVITG